ncbi:MAG: ribonuclease HI [Deltaproteobacteria bacterium]|nr:ribonuclease HI [Deltaproteobacteria bacterium]
MNGIQDEPGPDWPEVTIYTDGACQNNPGPGGWAAVLSFKHHSKELSGCEPLTTNNRMEMTAAVSALEALKRPCRVTLYSDSKYLIQGITTWVWNWQKKGWKTSGTKGGTQKDVLNRDLWEKLVKLVKEHQVTWEWVRGHAGHTENEQCDRLAKTAIGNCK